MEGNIAHHQGGRCSNSIDNAGGAVESDRYSHTSSSSSFVILDDAPSFTDPWHTTRDEDGSNVNHATSSSNHYNNNNNTSNTTTTTPRGSTSHSIPGTPPNARPSTSSSSSHFRILRSFSSRFVEDLPEFRPYNNNTTTANTGDGTTTPPHKRRFKSSPSVSLSALRRRSNATHVTTTPIISRSIAGESTNASHGIQGDNHKRHESKSNQRWKPMLSTSACLSIAAIASTSKAGHRASSSSQSRLKQSQQSKRHSQLEKQPEMIYDASITRRPSKLKKRPPSTIQSSILQSNRGSTYTEWRKSMVVEVSADVSRRSSQRSKRSTISRGATSTSARSTFAPSTVNDSNGRKGLIRKNQRRKSRNGILRRLSRRLIGLLRCHRS